MTNEGVKNALGILSSVWIKKIHGKLFSHQGTRILRDARCPKRYPRCDTSDSASWRLYVLYIFRFFKKPREPLRVSSLLSSCCSSTEKPFNLSLKRIFLPSPSSFTILNWRDTQRGDQQRELTIYSTAQSDVLMKTTKRMEENGEKAPNRKKTEKDFFLHKHNWWVKFGCCFPTLCVGGWGDERKLFAEGVKKNTLWSIATQLCNKSDPGGAGCDNDFMSLLLALSCVPSRGKKFARIFCQSRHDTLVFNFHITPPKNGMENYADALNYSPMARGKRWWVKK